MIFKYDPGQMRERLQRDGYAHLRDVLSDEFVTYLKDFLNESIDAASRESEAWKVRGKKRQFVFEFPDAAAAEEFRQGLARLTGIDAAGFTVSERHLKVYDDAAEPFPAPHKDRSASQYSIGLPVHLAPGSTVCIFPDLDRTPNPQERAVFMSEDDRPDLARIYETENAVMLNESVGDIVIFLGSALYHERVRPAGTAVLYIKVNSAGDDPLGENIYAGEVEVAPA